MLNDSTPSPLPPSAPFTVPHEAPVFRNALSEFVYTRTYARWLAEEGRRETWAESVDRYL